MIECKLCPVCGKKMVKKYRGYELTSYPPQRPWDWWCRCGHVEEGGVDRGMTSEEFYGELWEEANR